MNHLKHEADTFRGVCVYCGTPLTTLSAEYACQARPIDLTSDLDKLAPRVEQLQQETDALNRLPGQAVPQPGQSKLYMTMFQPDIPGRVGFDVKLSKVSFVKRSVGFRTLNTVTLHFPTSGNAAFLDYMLQKGEHETVFNVIQVTPGTVPIVWTVGKGACDAEAVVLGTLTPQGSADNTLCVNIIKMTVTQQEGASLT